MENQEEVQEHNMENQEEIYVNMEYRLEHESINVDEEHQILSKEEIKSSSIVCYVLVTLTDIYPCPTDDFDNIQYILSNPINLFGRHNLGVL